MVGWLFLAVQWGCLRFVIVVFPDHTHLLFSIAIRLINSSESLESLLFVERLLSIIQECMYIAWILIDSLQG